jgi:hypothetical protein
MVKLKLEIVQIKECAKMAEDEVALKRMLSCLLTMLITLNHLLLTLLQCILNIRSSMMPHLVESPHTIISNLSILNQEQPGAEMIRGSSD